MEKNAEPMSVSTTMAIDEKTTDLLKGFWEKNEDIIMALMDVIAADKNQDKDVREKAKAFAGTVKKSYWLRYKGETSGPYRKNGQDGVVVNGVRIYAKAHPTLTADEIQNQMKKAGCGNIFADAGMPLKYVPIAVECAGGTTLLVKDGCYGPYLDGALKALSALGLEIK